MSKTTNRAKKGRSERPTDNGPMPGPESLDQVRDILFGGQMRMVETRLQGLEERLLRESQGVRAELTRQITDLEGSLRKELDGLTERVQAERARRAEELKALGSDLKEAIKALEKRHGKLEEAAGLADAELRDQILAHSAALSAELSQLGSKLGSELEQAAARLDADKLDTSRLAGLIGQLAVELGDAPRSAKGSSRG